MTVRRQKHGGYRVDFTIAYPDGTTERVRKRLKDGTRRQAEESERELREYKLQQWKRRRLGLAGDGEAPTFKDWWHGRFWRERVVGKRNKPAEQENKRSIYRNYLGPRFAAVKLDEIVAKNHVADFRAELVARVDAEELSEKRVNNILTPLSTALRYALDQGVIARMPRIEMLPVVEAEREWWEFSEYARLVQAAERDGLFWKVAVMLAGEAGLRIGEIRALVWERDLDLVAGTITVNRQTRHGIEGTPKGGRARKVPMTPALLAALKRMPVVRRGYVLRDDEGEPMTDNVGHHAITRICRQAGLPERRWHPLRHTFGTHCALFGVNPWRLQQWMGHKAISTTLKYVHVAEHHQRPLPASVLTAAESERDPDRRIVAMLSARTAHSRPSEFGAAARGA